MPRGKRRVTRLPQAPLVQVVGTVNDARVEEAPREEKVDHVWLSVGCGLPQDVLVSVNTRSLRSAGLGFDSRVRMAVVRGEVPELPPQGVGTIPRFDYRDFATRHHVFFETLDRRDAEEILLDLARGSVLLEAWGAPFRRHGREGIHQIHCRRPSHAFPEGFDGLDGGLKFFFRGEGGATWRAVLIKFDGQS